MENVQREAGNEKRNKGKGLEGVLKEETAGRVKENQDKEVKEKGLG